MGLYSLVLVQLSKLAEVGEVVPDGFKLLLGDVAVAVGVKVLEHGLHTVHRRGIRWRIHDVLVISQSIFRSAGWISTV